MACQVKPHKNSTPQTLLQTLKQLPVVSVLILVFLYSLVTQYIVSVSAFWLGFLITMRLLFCARSSESHVYLLKIVTDRKLSWEVISDAITQLGKSSSSQQSQPSGLVHALSQVTLADSAMKDVGFRDSE